MTLDELHHSKCLSFDSFLLYYMLSKHEQLIFTREDATKVQEKRLMKYSQTVNHNLRHYLFMFDSDRHINPEHMANRIHKHIAAPYIPFRIGPNCKQSTIYTVLTKYTHSIYLDITSYSYSV